MDKPVKKKRASNKPKETHDSTTRTRALKHLASYHNGGDSHYINKRYWEGFRVGLFQAVVAEEGSQSNVEKIIISEKTILKKGEWKKDPLQNGILNGRRFALTYLININYKMVFGDWVTPVSHSSAD